MNRASRMVNACVVVLCIVSALACFRAGWTRAPGAMDLYGYYGPARDWINGGDPYDRNHFSAIVAELYPTGHPAEVACPLLPSALTLFAPLALLQPEPAALVMWSISFCSLIFSLWAMFSLWSSGWSRLEQLVIAGLLLQSRLIQSVAYRGQPSLLILAAVLLALILIRRKQAGLAGAVLVLASIKFTLMLPVVAYLLWDRQWRALVSTTLVGAAVSIPPLLTIGVSNFIRGFADSGVFIANYNNQQPTSFHLTSWRAILAALSGALSPVVQIGSVVLLLAATGALLWYGRGAAGRSRPEWMFAGFSALGMVAVYHRVYDAVMLFPLVVLVWNELRTIEGRQNRAVLGLSAGLVAVLFVFSPQSVAQAASLWLVKLPNGWLLEPLNAWLCSAILGATLLILRRVKSQTAHGQPSQS